MSCYAGVGVILLANTAHNGGRLVHELGMHALISPVPEPLAKGGQRNN